MGYAPDWYFVVRAARYLGVAPWELMKQSALWMKWALMAEHAEHEAERQLQERAQRMRNL
jgi:hypothetical protein